MILELEYCALFELKLCAYVGMIYLNSVSLILSLRLTQLSLESS